MKLVEHSVHKGLFYLEWPDGSRSDDFYNKTRAKYYAVNIQARLDAGRLAEAPSSPTGAFNRGARYQGSSR